MKSFLRHIYLFSLPLQIILLILLISYIVSDPFKIIYSYDPKTSFSLDMNRDYVSTETFLCYDSIEHYDSFIFGSSRAIGYNPATWKKYIGKDRKPFSYDASSENIYSIYYKLKFLDALSTPLSNILILIDTDEYFFSKNKKEDSFLKKNDPKTIGNSLYYRIDFQISHLRAYFRLKYLISYYAYNLLGIDNKYTKTHRLRSTMKIEYPTNRMISVGFEEFLKNNPQYYKNKNIFYERSDKESIYEKQMIENTEDLLREIKRIFEKHHTNFKIIINPMYDQKKYCKADLDLLESIFGKDNVFDFSGINKYTNSKYNYYESFHFKPLVGDSIMKVIYKKDCCYLIDHLFYEH